jgi:DNA-binding transcriptional MocR family regulator
MQIPHTSTRTERPEEASYLYARLAAQLRAQIARGVLCPGDRLPSVRFLSRQEAVSISTVTQAYLSLEREGLLVARERSGYFVSAPPAAHLLPRSRPAPIAPVPVSIADEVSEVLGRTQETRLVPLGVAAPCPAWLPLRHLNRAVRSVLADEPGHSAGYGPLTGHPELRRQLARRAFAAGCTLDPDDILVTAGGLEALNLCLRAVTRPGDLIAVESPTYFGILQAAESLGLRVVEVPAEPSRGIRLDLLDQVLARHYPKAVVCMTTSHNPLGCVMSRAAKEELVALVTRRQVPLIEDDVFGDLAFGEVRPPAAKAFDAAGLVLLCSSFSKTLAPGLRLGWIEVGRFRDRARFLKGITSMSTASLSQLSLARVLEHGHFERHLRRLRLRLADQVSRVVYAVSEAFPPGTRLTRPEGGNLVWVQLPPRVNGTELYRHALEQGIAILPGEIFSTRGRHRGFVRLSCGAPWSPAIEHALGALGKLCHRMT